MIFLSFVFVQPVPLEGAGSFDIRISNLKTIILTICIEVNYNDYENYESYLWDTILAGRKNGMVGWGEVCSLHLFYKIVENPQL